MNWDHPDSLKARIARLLEDWSEEELEELDFLFRSGMASDALRMMKRPPKEEPQAN